MGHPCTNSMQSSKNTSTAASRFGKNRLSRGLWQGCIRTSRYFLDMYGAGVALKSIPTALASKFCLDCVKLAAIVYLVPCTILCKMRGGSCLQNTNEDVVQDRDLREDRD